MEIRPIPFGAGVEIEQKDGSYKFICRKGPKECLYQKWQACVFHMFGDRFDHYYDLYHCMITSLWINDHQPKGTQLCVDQYTTFQWKDIEQCANVCILI